MLKRFHFLRERDVSGTSGCGIVAEGCLFKDKGNEEVVVRWFGEHSSINIYHSISDVIWVHGHGDCTKLIWDDPIDDMKKD